MNYKILTYEQIDRTEWSRLVASSSTGTWFQTPEAYDFFASQPELFKPFVVGVASFQLPPEGRREQPTPNPSLKGGELSVHNPSHMSRLEQGPNSLPFREWQGLGSTFASVWGAHTADSTQYDLLKANAIKNRKSPTEAEAILWRLLKGNNMGLHFRRQHIILDYIVDFVCLEKGLVIELDGGYHNDSEQMEYDKQRTSHLEKLGYTELRFANEELLTNPDAVIAQIKSVASSLPSLQGGVGGRHLLPSLQGGVGVGLLRVLCIGYVTMEKSALKQMFTRRAIIVGGPCLADDATDAEVRELMGAVRKELQSQAIYVETRNFNDYSRWKEAFAKAGFSYESHLNFHVHTDQGWEAVEENIGKHRKKYIRLSFRDGATVTVVPNDGMSREQGSLNEPLTLNDELKLVHDYYEILVELYKTKVKMPLQPWEFFEKLYHCPSCKYLLVMFEGQVVGGSICMLLPGHGVYEWYACGKDGVFKNIHPSSVTKYAGMKYACENGYAVFDMMGAGKPDEEYGVRDFKAEFGGELVEHGRFLCVTKPLLYKIGVLGVKILKAIK